MTAGHIQGPAPDIAIVGAGAAGLCIARHLAAAGIPFVIYEAASQVGGLWVYDSDSGLSPAYLSLHLNSEARVTEYPDFPFPEGSPLYPNHFQVRSYLESYATHHNLLTRIRFRSQVERVESAGGRWRLTTSDGCTTDFGIVIVASGHQSVPRHPEWRGDFHGDYLHAHSYRVPEPYRGRHVLVVGTGNSAVDIAADICTVTASTTLCARSPVLIMPRMMFGVPMSRILAKIERPWLPWFIKRSARETLTWAVHGRMEQWGLRTPKKKTHATTHPSLMGHFVWGRVSAKPGIRSVHGSEIEFVDGTRSSYDTVIAATGYDYSIGFLPAELQPAGNAGLNLYLRMVHPAAQNLFFMGFFNVNGGGNIRLMDHQATWLTAVIAGKFRLPVPARMQEVVKRERTYLRRRFPHAIRYAIELEPRRYLSQMRRERIIGSLHAMFRNIRLPNRRFGRRPSSIDRSHATTG